MISERISKKASSLYKLWKPAPEYTFVFMVLFLYILFQVFLSSFIYSKFSFVTNSLLNLSTGILNFFGYEASYSYANFFLYIKGVPVILIGNVCNGLDLMYLLVILIWCYPIGLIHKIWFSVVGVLVLHFINLVRVICLTLNYWHFRQSFEFNHKYLFVVIVYGLMFLLWYMWVAKFGRTKKA